MAAEDTQKAAKGTKGEAAKRRTAEYSKYTETFVPHNLLRLQLRR